VRAPVAGERLAVVVERRHGRHNTDQR
jgi:hypothetical protein